MADQTYSIDTECLKTAEREQRAALLREPDDTASRLRLAWCLFLRAIYESGQERALSAAHFPIFDCRSDGMEAAMSLEQSAEDILGESLLHAKAVQQLSRCPEERNDVARLQSLIAVSGGHTALITADREAVRILARLTDAILQCPDEA